jgi:hypothetical protein
MDKILTIKKETEMELHAMLIDLIEMYGIYSNGEMHVVQRKWEDCGGWEYSAVAIKDGDSRWPQIIEAVEKCAQANDKYIPIGGK